MWLMFHISNQINPLNAGFFIFNVGFYPDLRPKQLNKELINELRFQIRNNDRSFSNRAGFQCHRHSFQ